MNPGGKKKAAKNAHDRQRVPDSANQQADLAIAARLKETCGKFGPKATHRIAERCHCSYATVLAWFSGNTKMRVGDLARVCDVMDFDPAYLLSGVGKPIEKVTLDKPGNFCWDCGCRETPAEEQVGEGLFAVVCKGCGSYGEPTSSTDHRHLEEAWRRHQAVARFSHYKHAMVQTGDAGMAKGILAQIEATYSGV